MNKLKLLALTGVAMLLPLSQSFNRSAARPASRPDLKLVEAAQPQTVTESEPFVFAALPEHWVDSTGVPNLHARTLLAYLQNADAHGLDPADYNTDAVAQLVAKTAIPDAERDAFEKTLTNAFAAYVADMTGPRVSPSLIGSRAEYWRTPMTKAEALAACDAAGSLHAMLQGLEPATPLYAALKTELRHLTTDSTVVDADKKIPQVVANLERLRWDKERPARYIEVNLATQTLQAIDGKDTINIDVIVGKKTLPTAEFTTPITGIRFNPTWHVPVDLMMRDKVPALKKNPYAFEKSKLYVYYDGRKVDPGSVNWNGMSNAEIRKHISMKQAPGEHNALGHLIALMQNPYTQFLHYTSQPELFNKENRYFSSGCMRMQDPDTVAAFIMQTTKEDIASYKGGKNDNNVKAPAPVTFFSVYRSITLDQNGQLVYHTDTYGRDKKIYDALKAKGKLPALNNKPPAPK